MKQTLVLFIILTALCNKSPAQNTIRLNNTVSSGVVPPTPLENTLWQFAPGDNLQWAQPAFNDSNWKAVKIVFGTNDIQPGWQGYGWFRVWIKKDSLSETTVWGLRVNQDGAAEIFWDGKKIGGIGVFDTHPSGIKAARAPYTIFPVVIRDTLPHLLAIRYANFNPAFSNFTGFQAWLGDMHPLNEKSKTEQGFYNFLLMSVAIQFMLVLLHLLLFVFYPRHKINLYYSIFVFVTALAGLARNLSITTTDPYLQYNAYMVFVYMMVFIPYTSALLFYYVSYNRLPRIRFITVTAVTVIFLLYIIAWGHPDLVISNAYFKVFINSFSVLVFIDGTIAIAKAIRRGNNLLWLIAIAMCIVIIVNVVIGSNLFGWFTFRQVMGYMGIFSLLLPVMFSVYLAINVARTNRRLEGQLAENKRLAAENLVQEQEKTRLVSEQAEKLEKTVMERTAEVREQAQKLQEMDAVKSRFFVNLTHEFKTPLTLIINPARELLHQTNEAASKQYAQFILKNSERLLQLINQLLDLSRIENGQLEIIREPVDIAHWLHNYVMQHESLAANKNIVIGLSSTVEQLAIMADMDKMEKMVQNLLSNAIKFSDSGNNILVELHVTDANNFIIAVSDNGIGIPAEKLPYIFDRFYQVDASDTRNREGAGIGLALTKELAELLGGTITVISSVGKGARFILELPLIPAVAQMNASATIITVNDGTQVSAPSPSVNDERPLILLVEDNADLRNFISISLSENYQVIAARDGAEGITMALQYIPLLVITDLMMPVQDGYQLCYTLKNDARTSHIPIIMLTARADQDSRIQGIETGADAYLPKPFDKRELLAVTGNLIKIRQQLMEKYGRDNVWLTDVEQLPSIEQQFLDEVRKAIETHLDDTGYGADQLAADIALSRTQLHRKLKQLINKSPGELVRTIRMQRAHELLQKNAATVTEVCYMVGYGNPANFSTSFSKHFGYPPSEVPRVAD